MARSYTYCAECGELRVHDRESDGTYVTLRPCPCEGESDSGAGAPVQSS